MSTSTRPADPGTQLLDGLEALVRRHRALRADDTGPLHAELITAEVAQHLAVARNALRRRPRAV
ncbi:hypothetical protein H7X46_14455 [Pseudonocardia sp. C8]|uniref:hypothetical protein n=1 Tax=Pseudonocardia sp. C8 TaxID=2762759 RepID=UPI001642E793|nr:hypothetical protein [Pseudonocardia sp. C8]MBC3192264.1 hypothetical protein [Pseudonocardia sp. C8]